MSRSSRIVIPNVAHHVTQRGSRRSNVFFCEADYQLYLKLLSHYAQRFGSLIIGYCLMINHVHLILVPLITNALARTLAATHRSYAQNINSQKGWSGHLWQERFYSCPLDDDYFWTALRYVERNPVKAGLVTHASEFQWSSAKAHCNLEYNPFLSSDPKWTDIWIERTNWYETLKNDGDPQQIQLLRARTLSDLPCGNEEFIAKLEIEFGRSLTPKPRGRPWPKEKVPATDPFPLCKI